MNRKRWTVRALRMDLRCGASGTGCCTPAKIICIFLLAILMHEEAVRSNRLFEADTSETRQPSDGEPYFDTTISSNVTGLVGKTVQLVCKVKNLGNRTVAWVRHRDIHLLTAGVFTYTSDQRFTAVHVPHMEDWILRINFAQKKDTGTYECQLSNTPPISRYFHLTVVEPVTEIAGGPDFFINKGSTINLTCLVRHAPEPPSAIIWSHNHETINFETPRGGISLVTERGPVTSSRLLIQRATKEDSGLYTCAPGMMHPASARVHIVNDLRGTQAVSPGYSKLYTPFQTLSRHLPHPSSNLLHSVLLTPALIPEHPAAMHHGHGDRISAGLITMVLLLSVVI